MKRSRRKVEELLWVTGLHTAARTLYRYTVGRRTAQTQVSMTSFYRRLIPPNVLVFDVGANVGRFSAVFSSLGAKVVALEPNRDLVRHIELSYDGFETIQAVVGPKNGLALLNQSDEKDDLSSISKDWIAVLKREHQEYSDLWSRQVTVPMMTLDALIEHYGIPYFIKIDVEGFEESVLDGLSHQPALLSFEFNTVYLDAPMRCLEKQVFSGESLFNFAMGDPVKWELLSWVGRDQLKEILSKMVKADRPGDIFVKLPAEIC